METYIRLMVLKARYRWGYRVLVAEVSDSIHLRRFCRISLGERVPDESTVRKLTRRIGAETVAELTRSLIETAVREKRFRPRAVRIDSTVIEADVRYPTDADLASHGVKVLAREGRKLATLVKETKRRVRDRSRSMGRKLRALTRTIRRRSGDAKAEVLALTEQTGELLERSDRSAQARCHRQAQSGWTWRGHQAPGGSAAGGARGSLREDRHPDPPARGGRADHRSAGVDRRPGREADPQGQARQAQRVRVRQPDLRGDRTHPLRRAGADRPGRNPTGEPGRGHTAPDTINELTRLGIRPREIALDGGFNPGPTRQALEDHGLTPDRVFIAGRHQPGSRHTQRRLQRYRTGAEGRISHLKRGYGINRSRLKGDEGRQIWTGWSILTYNADTLAVRSR